MALSLSSMALPKPKKKPVTLQTEEQAVAKPVALQQRAPSPPRETMPAATQAPVKAPVVQGGAPAMTTFSSGGTLPKPTLPSFGERAPPTPKPQPTPMSASGAAGTGGTNIPVTGPGDGDRDRNGVPDVYEIPYENQGPRTVAGGPLPGAEETIRQGVEAGALPASNEQFNEQIRMLMQDLVSGRGMDVNTAEEEALIKELMQDRLGQGLVEQRARMGRAGFGASGALAAMEGDVRRQAGQQATQETLALRRQAEQEAIRNALQAVGVDIGVRGEARKAAFDEEFLNALKSSLGIVDEVGGETPEESGLSTDNPANARVQGNSIFDPVTGNPYEIRSSANPNDMKTRVLDGSNGVSYAIYLDSEKSTPGNNVLYAVRG
jgi:type II secretory pathway pseudopilin PulG